MNDGRHLTGVADIPRDSAAAEAAGDSRDESSDRVAQAITKGAERASLPASSNQSIDLAGHATEQPGRTTGESGAGRESERRAGNEDIAAHPIPPFFTKENGSEPVPPAIENDRREGLHPKG
jgi:hypothetical protein